MFSVWHVLLNLPIVSMSNSNVIDIFALAHDIYSISTTVTRLTLCNTQMKFEDLRIKIHPSSNSSFFRFFSSDSKSKSINSKQCFANFKSFMRMASCVMQQANKKMLRNGRMKNSSPSILGQICCCHAFPSFLFPFY